MGEASVSAPRHMRREDDVDLDYSERAGFLTGKSAAIADWQHRKEQREFRKLCEALYKKKWFRDIRAAGGERWERLRARMRANRQRWRNDNREHVRAVDRARKAARRKPRFIVCAECGAKKQIRRSKARGFPSRFCSTKCRNRWHGRPRAKARNRGIRQMDLVHIITAALVTRPMTLAELRTAIPSAKAGSLATKLCTMVKAGELVDDGKRKCRRYMVPEQRERAA